MNAKEIKSMCIEASEFYYNYLEGNNKGIEKINISKKKLINEKTDTWEVHIGKKLFNPDYIKIYNKQYDEYYDLNHFIIKEYDADNKLLIIKFFAKTNFSNTSENNLKIISDLKFLIKNVTNWYTENGQKLSFNKSRSNITNEQHEKYAHKLDLNTYQKQALYNIIHTDYNYIWGPPGTGKTRFVLSSAILHYLNDGSPKIGIFAPTNNSLEEILSSIIEHFDNLGIPRESLLRIGTPSRSFAEDYPETCEIQGIEKKLNEIEKQKNIIESVLEYRRGQYAFNSLFSILKDIKEINNLNTKQDRLLQIKLVKNKELDVILKESKSIKNQLKSVLNIDTVDYKVNINSLKKDLLKIQNQIDRLNDEIETRFLRVQNVNTKSDRIKSLILNINTHNYKEISKKLSRVSSEINEFLERNKSLSDAYSENSIEKLCGLKTKHEKNILNLKSMKLEERIKKCSIIGMTLDCYVGRFSNLKINFTNIFLDEAGYVPLIKALTLFSNQCGITFLGDHKQLPPVCELDDYNNINPKFHFLWSKPSIFSEIIFNHTAPIFLKTAKAMDCPSLKFTKKSILIESHRFGQNLAQLLDSLVYNVGFKSAKGINRNVNLYFVNAENPIRKGRKNINECNRIIEILNNYINDDYCILTPYKDQVGLLQRNIQKARQADRIMTIHKSQGREWDTVILSVVDGSNISPFFTDSTNMNSQGTHVLNTAISRVKNNLIIVCDSTYWFSKQDSSKQILSNLINMSKVLIN